MMQYSIKLIFFIIAFCSTEFDVNYSTVQDFGDPEPCVIEFFQEMGSNDDLTQLLDEYGQVKVAKYWEKLYDYDKFRVNADLLEARCIEKGKRPPPSTYLEADYIENHLSKFSGGAVKVVSYVPKGTLGPPGGTFVLPESLMDYLIIQADEDVNKLEYLLGLEKGYLGEAPNRIDIPNPTGIRMSTGNELGVNEDWIPGGLTSGGISEAVVDPIPEGNYTWKPIFDN